MSKCKYRISIKTADIDKAGTNANVHLILKGIDGETKQIVLNPLLEKDIFERGNIDTFDDVELDNVGIISSIILGHDNSHFNPGWFLEYINILDKTGNRYYNFPCHKWLAKDEGDGKIERTLFPDTDQNEDAYFLTIKTGNMEDAGTDSDVFIILHGDKKDSKRVVLNTLMSGKVFMRGAVDQVLLEDVDEIGFVHSITVGRDNKSHNTGWYLEQVTVQHTNTGQVWEFDCFKWLSDSKADMKIEQTFYVNNCVERDIWSKRPFYAIAHMCNDKDMVIRAIDCGANAIECDIKVENPNAAQEEPYRFKMYHGSYPIISYGMIASPIEQYLTELKKVIPSLAMIMFDCKDSEEINYKKYGLELCNILKKYNIDPKLCIMSLPYIHMIDFFEGMKDEKFDAVRDISMFDSSPENNRPSKWLSIAERYDCNVLGMGIDAFTLFASIKDWIEPLKYSTYRKYNNGIVKKVYYYTLNKMDSIIKILDTGVDGIICNMRPDDEVVWEGLEGMIEVLKENKYYFTHRMATSKDSLNESFGYVKNPLICSKLEPYKKFFIRNGSKHLIPDEKTFENMRFSKPAAVMEDDEFSKIPFGEDLFPLESPLIKLADSEKLYFMVNGNRCYLPDDKVLVNLGFKREQAVDLPKKQMNKLWLNKSFTAHDFT